MPASMISPLMLPLYDAALNKVRGYVASFDAQLYGPRQERSEALRISLRERRDYWHALGSKILRRMDRESKRRSFRRECMAAIPKH